MKCLFILALACIVTVGCAQNGHATRNLAMIESLGKQTPVEDTYRVDGLTIHFSNKHGWENAHTSPSLFSAGKVIEKPLHTAAIQAWVIHPPKAPFENDEKFFEDAKMDRITDRHQEIKRIEASSEPGTGRWKTCLKYHKVFSTPNENSNYHDVPLLYEESGYMCRHPLRTNYFLRIDYSERYPGNVSAQQFGERAASILDNITFE